MICALWRHIRDGAEQAALAEPERKPEVICVDRVMAGQEYVLKMYHDALEREEYYRGLRMWDKVFAWHDVATTIYTTLARPWFEDKQ